MIQMSQQARQRQHQFLQKVRTRQATLSGLPPLLPLPDLARLLGMLSKQPSPLRDMGQNQRRKGGCADVYI